MSWLQLKEARTQAVTYESELKQLQLKVEHYKVCREQDSFFSAL